jgi:hypothetical protein
VERKAPTPRLPDFQLPHHVAGCRWEEGALEARLRCSSVTMMKLRASIGMAGSLDPRGGGQTKKSELVVSKSG